MKDYASSSRKTVWRVAPTRSAEGCAISQNFYGAWPAARLHAIRSPPVSCTTTPVPFPRQGPRAAARTAFSDPRGGADDAGGSGHLLWERRHLQPRAARSGRAARRPQGAHIAALSPRMIATANPGCILQIAAAVAGSGTTGGSFIRSS